jgi:hypothetical protein
MILKVAVPRCLGPVCDNNLRERPVKVLGQRSDLSRGPAFRLGDQQLAKRLGPLAGSLSVVKPEFFRARGDYLASLPPGAPPDPVAFGALPGAESRPTVGPPLSS